MGQASDFRCVIVGKIGAPYGVRGWVKVHSFTEPAGRLFTYQLLIETRTAGWQDLKVADFRPHTDCFVAKLDSVEDRDQAALYTNAQIAVLRDDLPQLAAAEHYWADLLGLAVYNQDNVLLGNVADIFSNGANDVLVVRGAEGEHLIPYALDTFVVAVDLAQKQIQVRWDLEQ